MASSACLCVFVMCLILIVPCDMSFIHSFTHVTRLLSTHSAQSLLRDWSGQAVMERTDMVLLSQILESDVELSIATLSQQARFLASGD